MLRLMSSLDIQISQADHKWSYMRNINDELRRAAENGDEESLKALLLNPKCDALAKDEENWTALMYAACRGHTSCVQLLLPVSDALVKDNYGTTALMLAAGYGHTSCVQLLLPVSDALAMNKHGKTARSLANEDGHDATASLINAYTLAMSELAALHSSVTIGQPRRSKALRV